MKYFNFIVTFIIVFMYKNCDGQYFTPIEMIQKMSVFHFWSIEITVKVLVVIPYIVFIKTNNNFVCFMIYHYFNVN